MREMQRPNFPGGRRCSKRRGSRGRGRTSGAASLLQLQYQHKVCLANRLTRVEGRSPYLAWWVTDQWTAGKQ